MGLWPKGAEAWLMQYPLVAVHTRELPSKGTRYLALGSHVTGHRALPVPHFRKVPVERVGKNCPHPHRGGWRSPSAQHRLLAVGRHAGEGAPSAHRGQSERSHHSRCRCFGPAQSLVNWSVQ